MHYAPLDPMLLQPTQTMLQLLVGLRIGQSENTVTSSVQHVTLQVHTLWSQVKG